MRCGRLVLLDRCGFSLDWRQPLPELFDASSERGEVESRRSGADGIDPDDLAALQETGDEVLGAAGMTAPVVREHDKWGGIGHFSRRLRTMDFAVRGSSTLAGEHTDE
jgi:hypothetical protein